MASPRPNQLYVVISLALVLFLLGLVGLWTFQANSLTRQLQEQLDIVVELEKDHSPAQRSQLIAHLGAADYHQPGTVPHYVSKNEAMREMGEDLERDLGDLGLANPLLDVVTFNVNVEDLAPDRLKAIAQEVQALPGVAGVFYQENFVERIAANARRLSLILLVLAGLFALVAGLLIHNTVRLSLYANRFTIKTQELVGASWGFISRPYLWRAVGQGFVAGLLASAGVFCLQFWLNTVLPELKLFSDVWSLGLFYGSLLLLGIVINFFSHLLVVRRYLRLRLDDLY
ncbi:MAG: permease-like cell division protein FtsX [Bacteroidota bacterium]